MDTNKIYYNQAVNELEANVIHPAYLLYGEEIFLTDSFIDLLKTKFLKKVDPEINFFIRYASENGVDEIISLGSTSSLFSNKKIIILKEAQDLKQSDLDRLSKFFLVQSKDICIVLTTLKISLFQTRLKNIESQLRTVHLLPLREPELNKFIEDRFSQLNKRITPEAIDSLKFLVGIQLADLITQMNNISSYFSDKNIIDVEDIEKVTAIYITQNIFTLGEYLEGKNIENLTFVINKLLYSGISAQQILFQIIKHFTILWKIHGLYRNGIKRSDLLSKELGIFNKYVEKYINQSQNWKSPYLAQIFNYIHYADVNLKNSNIKPEIILDMLSCQILNLYKINRNLGLQLT